VETSVDCGAKPDVQQAAQEEDEAADWRQLSSRSWRHRRPKSLIQTGSLTPWDVYYNAMEDYWYY
jgi:hypothetical protein